MSQEWLEMFEIRHDVFDGPCSREERDKNMKQRE